MGAHKFSFLEGSDFNPYAHPNVWSNEKTTGPDRLVVAPSSGHVELMVELSRALPEPFGILYVLLISRLDNEPGRYQCPAPCGRSEMEAFLKEFEAYFESDGRHHVWVMSLPAAATLVYDQHNVIYAYGPLERYEKVLRKAGLKEGAVNFPAPHAHNYNPQYDEQERRVLNYWDWRKTPLLEGDDL